MSKSFSLPVVSCLALLAGSAVGDEKPTVLTVPLIEAQPFGIEAITAIVHDPTAKKVYVGSRSRGPRRLGLLVFDVAADGSVSGPPRRYADHPEPQPAGQHSTITCFALDARHRKLFLGVSATQKEFAKPLVMWDLDAKGEPTGAPQAFDNGNPRHTCQALALHPRLNRLYSVGWGGEGFYSIDLDDAGRPVQAPVAHRVGGQGKYSMGFRSDGSKIYLGTYPYILEVCDLDRAGNLTGKPRRYPIADGPKDYLRMTATDRGVYYRGTDGHLQYLALDAAGEPTGPPKKVERWRVEAVNSGSTAERLLLAVETGFPDAISGKWIANGVQVQEIALEAGGAPGAVLRQSPVYQRLTTAALGNGSGSALGAVSRGNRFLGNRFSGLQVRTTLVSVQASAPLLPVTDNVVFSKQPRYARFAYSPARQCVYLAADNSIAVCSLKEGGKVVTVACPDVSGAVAVDDTAGILYAARSDGTVAVRPLDAAGRPADKGDNLAAGVQPIVLLQPHPKTRQLYVFGPPTAARPTSDRIIRVPASTYENAAAVDPERGRLYVCSSYHGTDNLAVWKLEADGRLADAQPRRFADGFRADDPKVRGILSSLQLDTRRRKLYLGGHPERSGPGGGAIVVHDLDAQGDPTGTPRILKSASPRGFVSALALSPDGHWLFDASTADPHVYARRLDAKGEPAEQSQAWNAGGTGKAQLTATVDGSFLLAGTHPSTLQVLHLGKDGQPLGGLQAVLTLDKQSYKLGLLQQGKPGSWVNLDESLQNGIGTALARCTLTGAPVERATLRFEVALAQGQDRKPLRTVQAEIAGPVAALFVPRYGIEDLDRLPSLVQSSAERYHQYLGFAEKNPLRPEERPRRFVVANGLIGVDSSPAALEDGLKLLALMGHNTVQIWNWPGIAPADIRAAAHRHGLERFRWAIYNPPSYFDFNTDKVQPAFLDQWAAGFHKGAASMGARPEELALFHMADEPGWYFPHILEQIKEKPESLAVFRKYLRSRGLTPELLGKKSWDEVGPMTLSAARTLPERRLLFWTARYCAESLSTAFAQANAALRRQLQPNLHITTNLNNWPGRFFLPSPGKKIANNRDTGPDAAMGMPDWFDLGRKQAVSCLWTEDWFADADAQQWSLYADLLRCAAREGGVEFGGYVVGHSTGGMPDGGKYKVLALAGHGAKAFDPYIFGPNPAFADGWSEKPASYVSLAEGLRALGKAERLLYPGRPRAGNVAVLLPQASQVWDGEAGQKNYLAELYGLHAALIHDHYAVDFVDDFGIEDGALAKRKYGALYVTAPNLSVKAQKAVIDWTQAGGTVVLLPGACAADEYNEPTDLFDKLLGMARGPVPRMNALPLAAARQATPTPVTVTDARLGIKEAFAIGQTVPLAPGHGKVLAAFGEGKPAVTAVETGKGRVECFGSWPGLTYWSSPDRTDRSRLPQDWSRAGRKLATAAPRLAGVRPLVDVSVEGVEGVLLESDQGIAVTLLNWTGRPLPEITVTVTQPGVVSTVESIERGRLEHQATPGELRVRLPLQSADVLLLHRIPRK